MATVKLPVSQLPKVETEPPKGCKRQWVICRNCLHIQFYDYMPYTLSNPVMCCGKCGGNKNLFDVIEIIPDEKPEGEVASMFKPLTIQKFDTEALKAGELYYVSHPEDKDDEASLCFVLRVSEDEVALLAVKPAVPRGTFEPKQITLKAQDAYDAGVIFEQAYVTNESQNLLEHATPEDLLREVLTATNADDQAVALAYVVERTLKVLGVAPASCKPLVHRVARGWGDDNSAKSVSNAPYDVLLREAVSRFKGEDVQQTYTVMTGDLRRILNITD